MHQFTRKLVKRQIHNGPMVPTTDLHTRTSPLKPLTVRVQLPSVLCGPDKMVRQKVTSYIDLLYIFEDS